MTEQWQKHNKKNQKDEKEGGKFNIIIVESLRLLTENYNSFHFDKFFLCFCFFFVRIALNAKCACEMRYIAIVLPAFIPIYLSGVSKVYN